jgi:UDP-glucose 4-epimerase
MLNMADDLFTHHQTEYQGVEAVLLGGSGFIGRWVARALSESKARLRLVLRNPGAAERIFSRYNIQGDIYQLDLRDFSALIALLRKLSPTVIFNLAGYGVGREERDKNTAYLINAYLVEAICAGMAENLDPNWAGQHIVHVGSALEYGAIGGDLSEDSAPNPTTLYGISKLTGTRLLEQNCRTYGINGLTARLFMIYGPGERSGRLLPSLIETARTGNILRMTEGYQKRDFTYVQDVAEGLLRLGATRTSPGCTVNLATGRLTTVRGFAETAARILDVPAGKLQFGALPTRPEEMAHESIRVERLKELTGWLPPTEIVEGIRNTLVFDNEYVFGGSGYE